MSSIKEELTRLAQENGGVLAPHDVVLAAMDEGSVLHSWFDWDDTTAAEKYRLHQARMLISRVKIQLSDDQPQNVRAFISLKPDRHGDSGYRVMTDVLSDEQFYQQMLDDALDELTVFERKYSRLKELKPLFKTLEKLR